MSFYPCSSSLWIPKSWQIESFLLRSVIHIQDKISTKMISLKTLNEPLLRSSKTLGHIISFTTSLRAESPKMEILSTHAKAKDQGHFWLGHKDITKSWDTWIWVLTLFCEFPSKITMVFLVHLSYALYCLVLKSLSTNQLSIFPYSFKFAHLAHPRNHCPKWQVIQWTISLCERQMNSSHDLSTI